MGKDRIHYLLRQYSLDRASREEVAEMFEWLKSIEGEDALKAFILDSGREKEEPLVLADQDWDRIWSGIKPSKVRFLSGARLRVAAALILLAMTGACYWLLVKGKNKTTASPLAIQGSFKNDIAPGGQRALLTLANGSTIVLDSARDGMVAQQGNTHILKLDAGALAYNEKNKNAGGVKNDGEVLFNTIATPAGGQYRIVLPDGSRVWLNAASSLRFPTAFAGKDRSVELTGEAYFEIAKNAGQPFHVRLSGGTDVLVLGTNFNIMAYSNEQDIRTTLLEGSVKVFAVSSGSSGSVGSPGSVGLNSSTGASNSNREGVKLEPGRQAIIDNQSHALKVAEVNTEQVVAWKNGMFRFKETPIRELMRQVERWYDVKIIYNTDRKDQDYTGVVPLNQPVSALLQTLELTGTVHFRIEGRSIIVLP